MMGSDECLVGTAHDHADSKYQSLSLLNALPLTSSVATPPGTV